MREEVGMRLESGELRGGEGEGRRGYLEGFGGVGGCG